MSLCQPHLISSHVSELEGVLVAYSNIKFSKNVARILNDNPFLHISVTGNFTVFNPAQGSQLVGVVNKVSSNHIGLLVHGVFNASIPASEIPVDAWDDDAESWRTTDKLNDIKNGTVLRFQCLKNIISHQVLSITGSLENLKETGVVEEYDHLPLPVIAPMETEQVEEVVSN